MKPKKNIKPRNQATEATKIRSEDVITGLENNKFVGLQTEGLTSSSPIQVSDANEKVLVVERDGKRKKRARGVPKKNSKPRYPIKSAAPNVNASSSKVGTSEVGHSVLRDGQKLLHDAPTSSQVSPRVASGVNMSVQGNVVVQPTSNPLEMLRIHPYKVMGSCIPGNPLVILLGKLL